MLSFHYLFLHFLNSSGKADPSAGSISELFKLDYKDRIKSKHLHTLTRSISMHASSRKAIVSRD